MVKGVLFKMVALAWFGLAWLGLVFIVVDEIGSRSMCVFGNGCFTMWERGPCKRWAFCSNSTGDPGHCCTLLQNDLWSASRKYRPFPPPAVVAVVAVVVVVAEVVVVLV